MWEVYGVIAFVVIGVSALWVKGITDMHEKHPDYKGEEFNGGFNFDDNSEWDVTLMDGLGEDEENRKDYDED